MTNMDIKPPQCTCGSKQAGLIWISDENRYQCGICLNKACADLAEISKITLDEDPLQGVKTLVVERDELQSCGQATLLFHRGAYWNNESAVEWKRLTGAEEATTKTLCDAIRKALGESP